MVKVIMGPKGTGKTKQLVELVHKAVEEEHGNVVCIEKNKALTYDIPYQARLIHASDYEIGTFEFMKGFISGLYAGNYDITHIFIDNFHQIFKSSTQAEAADLLDWLAAFSEKTQIKFTITMTLDPSTVEEGLKKYI